jgi:putative ABC transport system ATP-binding protein
LTTTAPILEAVAIGRKAPEGQSWLLEGVSFSVLPGDRVAIVGPSGAGKTLVLRSLACLDPLDAGEIHWHGLPIHRAMVPDFRRQVIYLHQRPVLFDGTVEANLQLPLSLSVHHGRKYDRDYVLGFLLPLGRGESFLAQPVENLSGGEGQIVALLRALQLDPQVLLLDEPTAALDGETEAAVELLVEDWWQRAKDRRAVVWVSHDRQQILRMTGRIVSIKQGRLEGDRHE